MAKVKAGESIRLPTATEWNGWEAAADYTRQNQQSEGTPPDRSPIATDLVKIRNETGETLPRGSTVRIGRRILKDEAFTPDHLWLGGFEPSVSDDDAAAYGILRRPAIHGAMRFPILLAVRSSRWSRTT